MRPVLMTTDPVLLGFACAVLADCGIVGVIWDQYTSAIEGSVGIFPRRLLVGHDAWHRARRALAEAGLAAELAPDDGEGPEAAWTPDRRNEDDPT